MALMYPLSCTCLISVHIFLLFQVLVQEVSEVLMGTFYFVSVDGEPVLMGYDPTECSGIHLVRLFLQQHAPAGSCFYSWRFKPPVGVGIEKFWDVLRSKGGLWARCCRRA